MAYFPDLSPYTYSSTKSSVLNIGWLSRDYPFPTGDVPPELLPRLITYLETVVVNQYRGLQTCHFCENGLAYRDEGPMGSAELRVFADDGTTYAAPTLVIHYISKHRYQPPQAFIDAVLDSPLPPDKAYVKRLEAAGEPFINWRHPRPS